MSAPLPRSRSSPKSPTEFDDRHVEDELVRDFRSSARVDPANMKALELLGQAVAGQADKPEDEEPVKEFQPVASVDPANMKALELLGQAVAGDSNTPEDEEPVKEFQPVASVDPTSLKALRLLDQAIASDANRPEDEVKDFKSSSHRERERGANMRALQLLDQLSAGEAHKPKVVSPLKTGPKTAKQAAMENYEKERAQRNQAKAMVHEIKKNHKPTPKLVAEKKMEKMAQTTRKIKKTPDDVRDPETVAGMKCQLDYERQKYAEEKALKLVESEGYAHETGDHDIV